MKNKKNSKQRTTKSNSRFGRLTFILGFIAAASLVAGAATVLSHRQRTSSAPAANQKKYLTVKVAGRDVQVDAQTGQVRPLTADEAKQLADGLKGMLNKSADGLVQRQQPDGTVSMDLDARFQNVVLAKKNADGSLSQSCVDNPEAAASFLGIDPQLLGAEKPAGTANQAGRVLPAKVAQQ